jgi:hypothetical protein
VSRPPSAPYTREEFERQSAQAKRVHVQDGRVLAAVSVGLAVAVLFLINWAEGRLPRVGLLAFALGAFLAYLAVMGILLLRMQRRIRLSRPVCPHCGIELDALAERIAASEGTCDSCGGRVIE